MTDEDEIDFILGDDDVASLLENIDGDLQDHSDIPQFHNPLTMPASIIDDFPWHPVADSADIGDAVSALQSPLLRSDHGAIATIAPLTQEHNSVDRLVTMDPNPNFLFSSRENHHPTMNTKRMNVVSPPAQENSDHRWISLPNNWQQHFGPPPPQDLFEDFDFDPNTVDEWFGATPAPQQGADNNRSSSNSSNYSSNIHKNQPGHNMPNHDKNHLSQQLQQPRLPPPTMIQKMMQGQTHGKQQQLRQITKMGQQQLQQRQAPLFNFPPIIHPPQMKQQISPIFPIIDPSLRKRKFLRAFSSSKVVLPRPKKIATVRGRGGKKMPNGPAVISPEVKAANARAARKLRRIARAKTQVIYLVGAGDISEIQRHAVKDSCLDNNTTPGISTTSTNSLPSASLLHDFFNNVFQPAMYVDMTLEWVHQTLSTEAAISGMHPKKGDEAAANTPMNQGKDSELTSKLHPSTPYPKVQPMETPSSSGTSVLMNTPPRNKPAQATTSATPKQASRGSANIVTPIKKRNKSSTNAAGENQNPLHKALPTGKDPESRRLRRLMRNRLSAQASRDRRKKAIADALQLNAQKKQEIARLEETMKEERKHLEMLEKAVNFAKEYLGKDGFAIVAGGSHPRGVIQSS
eukprot:CAMPEP_0183716494 /NCGR_PEP_ID=MMETSP0737-20130205/10395_1 /TAXON_ID=385413 /ORGANISM="Thalassiosira miniscula, Strain CCMP1093" /LENGTH=630 /DNA_ID=CAMNT_0025945775 /DNA_START=167 /DNA_END=2059 /DNA_ORIENTATION=+